jgi:hypothetical protein
MATPSDKLASSLEALKTLQDAGAVAIRSRDLTRTHRERLLKHGFLREVIKGWYVSSRPDENAGESTAWYASFWPFCASYLESRFGNDWACHPSNRSPSIPVTGPSQDSSSSERKSPGTTLQFYPTTHHCLMSVRNCRIRKTGPSQKT